MTTKLSYKIIITVGEEKNKGNAAFNKLGQIVSEHIQECWRPTGELRFQP